ncbi:hypothetical protein M1N16_03630 [Nitrospinaceae bacterium]|nr:hypothetical protein [Nitrospinaceae bacterium]
MGLFYIQVGQINAISPSFATPDATPSKPAKTAPRRILFRDMRTDKNGFGFNEDLDECKNKSKLIFCLGGSTTHGGAESRNDLTYPNILNSLIKDYGHRCVNAGVGGYKSIHELFCLRKKILPSTLTSPCIKTNINPAPTNIAPIQSIL